jgi:hypothetical protein
VTPPFLTAAKGQALCSLDAQTGYKCFASCEHTSTDAKEDVVQVKWFASPCGGVDQEECDRPLPKKKVAPPPKVVAEEEEEEEEEEKPVSPTPTATTAAKPSLLPGGELTWDPADVWDLRGLKCQLRDGKEQCYYEDSQGRELCPEYVTHEWLNAPPNQWLCAPEVADKYYCILGCQEGNPEVRWGANEIAWCYDPKNRDSCPPRPSRE